MGAQASLACPIGGRIPGAGPTGIIPGGGGPVTGIMGGPPPHMGHWPHTGARRALEPGGGGIIAPAGGGAENGVGGIFFLVEMQRLL